MFAGIEQTETVRSYPVKFFVPGVPRPKGSTRSFWNKKANKVVTMGDCKEQKGWQSLVSLRAYEMGIRPVHFGVRLNLTFHMPRPKAHFNAAGNLKPSAPNEHTKKSDLDKLVRLINDALTGIVYVDDSQVVSISASKVYTYRQDEQPGVSIEIWR